MSKSELRSLAGGGVLFCFALAVYFVYQAINQPLPILRQPDILAAIGLAGVAFGLLWIRKAYLSE